MTKNVDLRHMQRACELALSGQGSVEPNPIVGCVIGIGDDVIAEGCHEKFGAAHAEINALSRVPADRADDLVHATLYSTLEPCCHSGKTPPCTESIIQSGIRRVVVAVEDPFPSVAGKGIEALRAAGINVETGVLHESAAQQLAPYMKRVRRSLPWVIAKWAMSMDGKIATRRQDSQWISGRESREIVHRLRGRVDGIMIGMETALADNPRLTARPQGQRIATRIVLDSDARLPVDSQLVQSTDQAPTMIVAGREANELAVAGLRDAGVEVLQPPGRSKNERLQETLEELGRRQMTNILVEGGGKTLGSLFDLDLVDEVHLFLAPILVGGSGAPTASAGVGVERISESLNLSNVEWRKSGADLYATGLVEHRGKTGG